MAEVERSAFDAMVVRDGALSELERLATLIANLTPGESLVPSVAGWSVGEVVAHLDLFLGLYNRLLPGLLAGDPLARATAALDRLALSTLSRASPIFNAVNGALPRAAARLVLLDVLQARFLQRTSRTREILLRRRPEDYAGQSESCSSPLSFYLGIVVNELAVHGWDIESRMGSVAGLSDSARLILPWFYWSATQHMLRLPKSINGTVQVLLSEPASAMWWSITHGSAVAGRDIASEPDVTIRVSSGRYLLSVASRVRPADVLDSSTAAEGNRALADCFLGAWHII